MSDAVKIAMIVSLSPLIAAITALIIAIRAHHKLNEIHITMNSKLDALIASTQLAAFAEGKAEGIEQERQR